MRKRRRVRGQPVRIRPPPPPKRSDTVLMDEMDRYELARDEQIRLYLENELMEIEYEWVQMPLWKKACTKVKDFIDSFISNIKERISPQDIPF